MLRSLECYHQSPCQLSERLVLLLQSLRSPPTLRLHCLLSWLQ